MKNNTVKNIIKVSGLLAIMALTGCGDQIENLVFRHCKSGGGTTAQCECIWNDLSSKYTNDQMKYFIENPLESKRLGFNDAILNATFMCYNK